MKILAIESSSITASVAIVTDDMLTAEYTINNKKTHSQTLLPMIDEICRMTDTEIETIDAVAVSCGPGSFTGLRIGSATAKGIGLAMNIPLVSVPTVDAMAFNYQGSDKIICPIMDAKRGHVYTGIYYFEETAGKIKIELSQSLLKLEELILRLNEIGKEVIFLGDGIAVSKKSIEESMKVSFSFAPPHMSTQRAGSVAILGKIMLEAGMGINAGEHLPEYLRPSQAEREMAEKLGGKMEEKKD